MQSDIDPADLRRRLVKAAESVISGDVGILEGLREIDKLCNLAPDANDQIFYYIRGLVSENEDVILGSDRDLWSEEYLKRTDVKASEYLSTQRPHILSACEDIIARFSNTS